MASTYNYQSHFNVLFDTYLSFKRSRIFCARLKKIQSMNDKLFLKSYLNSNVIY